MMHFLQKQIGKWFVLALLLALAANAQGQTGTGIVLRKMLDGSKGQLAKDSAITIQDSAYFSATLHDKLDTPYRVVNAVTFRINEYTPVYLPPHFTASVSIRVIYTTPGLTVDSVAEKTLEISYDTANAYSARSSFVFSNAHQVTVKVLGITASVPAVVNALILENEMQVKPVYKLSCTEDAVRLIEFDDPSATEDFDELRIHWSATTGADEYDLEWAYIDSSALNNYGNPVSAQLLFENNASRVTVSDNSYSVPLMYDNGGVLFFRVRAVQDRESGGRVETDWSSDFDEGLGRFSFAGHQRNLNWQSDISYAEEGKRKVVVQYYDGSLRSRQTVTKDNNTNTTLVGESFYDYQGRPVIQVLPAPTLNTIIKYSQRFNTDINGAEYDKEKYDHMESPAEFLTASAEKMSPAEGSAKYYSENNEQLEGMNRFIPDAKGYAFTETAYTPDNTGRISRQGGVGPDYKLGSNHETKYYYNAPGDNDLEALFGTEVGDKSHYFKNTVRDANGQYTVTYLDMHGRTIATALSGKPANTSLEPLPSYTEFEKTDVLSRPGSNMVKELVMESRQSQMVTMEGEFEFKYTLTPPLLTINDCQTGAPVCYNAFYTLEITITDDSYNQLLPNQKPVAEIRQNYTFPNINLADCNAQAPGFSLTLPVHLKEGSYEITKRLTVSREAMDYYRDNFFLQKNQCKKLDDFIQEQRNLVANTQCVPTCASCMAGLGTLDQFRTNYISQAGLDDDPAAYENEIQAAYKEALDNCSALCGNVTEVDDIRKAMLADLTPPSGQYADLNDVGYKYSVFYQDQNTQAVYKRESLNYVDESGKPFLAYDENSGSYVKPQQLRPEQFSEKFNAGWAEILLPYHPEYCKLQEQEKYISSYRWDKLFEAVDTYADAKTAGYLNPTSNTTAAPFNGYPAVTANRDLLLADWPNLQTALESKLSNYHNGYSLWSTAVISVKCKQSESGCPAIYADGATAFDESRLCAADLDMAWRVYRALYMQVKHDIINNLVKSACQSPSAADLTGKQLHFNTTSDALSQNGLGYMNNNDVNDAVSKGEAALQQSFDENCNAYVDFWLQQLASCKYGQDAWNEIKPLLVQVCKEGSDANHPYGASTVKPGSTNTYKSFEDILNTYNANHGITNPLECNGLLITVPKPYDKQVAFSDKVTYTRPEDCECEKLNKLRVEYQANRIAGDIDFSAYLSRTRQVTIAASDLDRLLTACNTLTADCNFLLAPVRVPALMQCTTGPACATCKVVDSLYNKFTSLYPSIVPSVTETTEDQQKKNQLFANYMNNRLGFSKQAWEYLKFKDSCSRSSYGETVACLPTQGIRSYITTGGDVVYSRSSEPAASNPSTDVLYDMVRTPDNGYLMVGYTTYNSSRGKEAYIIKTDSRGAYTWSKAYGGTADDEFTRIKPVAAGGYILLGTTKSFGHSAGDIFVVRIDAEGNVNWSRAIGFGTTNGEAGRDIITTSDGGFAFAGSYDFNEGSADWVIGTLTAQGNFGWIKQMGSGSSDPTISLLEDNDKLIAAGTATFPASTKYDGAILKINKSNGALITAAAYDLETRTNWFGDIYKTAAGYRINGLNSDDWGNVGGEGTVLDIDNDENVISAKKMSFPNAVDASWLYIYPAANGSYISSLSLTGTSRDIYLERINADNSALAWSTQVQLTGDQNLSDFVEDADGNIVGTGVYDDRGVFMRANSSGQTGCGDVAVALAYTDITAAAAKRSITPLITTLTNTASFISLVGQTVYQTETVMSCQGSENCYTVGYGPLLCGGAEPLFPNVSEDINNCSDNDFFAVTTGTDRYNAYLESLKGSFDDAYIKNALKAADLENFTVTYTANEHHYTLYYYDQAGNLIKTVPPAGVDVHRDPAWLAEVHAARAAGTSKVPSHTLKTQYHYNTLNQVTAQESPDGGQNQFWYDRLGRLAVSQNAEQATKDAYSYTLYDELGRTAETGEINSNTPMSDAIGRDAVNLSQWLNAAAATKAQITRTTYDKPYTPLDDNEEEYVVLKGNNLRNRVSWRALYNTAEQMAGNEYETGTFYSYDIHGNVNTLIQDYKHGIMATTNNNRWKKLAYDYDLVSSKVNQVSYQPGQPDAFYHRYSYDAENRLTNVSTSHDGVYWENDAFYQYYKHGPLARMVLGQQQVQGLDYAYTLQGSLKGVNSTALTPVYDMGGDGATGSIVGKDVFGYALHYFGDGDYVPIDKSPGIKPFAGAEDAGASFKPLFNGNIGAMSVHLPSLGEPLLYAYNYDALNRLRGMNALRNMNKATNAWTPSLLNDFKENVTYDPNGNILTYQRNGNNTFAGRPIEMDNLTYSYVANKNQLDYVNDAVDGAGNYDNDIDRQTAGNYKYDKIGNLIYDRIAGIDLIEWTVYGKIKKIKKSNGITINYTYDVAGNRISKEVDGKVTWYVRDAIGNVISVYTADDPSVNSGNLTRTEANLYGSSRLGMSTLYANMQNVANPVPTNMPGLGTGINTTFTRGNKVFELSNHLGNVLATVSDVKQPISVDGATTDHYEANITSAQDYYPFGMLMPGRNGHAVAGGWASGNSVVNGYSVPASLTLSSRAGNQPGEYVASQMIAFTEGFNSGANDAFIATITDGSYTGGSTSGGGGSGNSAALGGYRYGFNGQEKSDELKGEGNSYTAQFWEYDSRIGQRWNTDPIVNPSVSSYSVFNGNPIIYNDPDGDCPTCPKDAKDGDTHTWGGLSFTYSSGSWTHTLNGVDVVGVATGNSSGRFKNWISGVGASGINARADALYQNKENRYQDGFGRAIYGVGSDGKTALPQSMKDRLRSEANAEAYPDLKNQWASDVSGWDPNSFGYLFNPIAWAGYYSARAEAVTTRPEGYALMTSVSVDVGLQWIGKIPLSKSQLPSFGGLYRRGGNMGAFSTLEVPMQMKVVKRVAADAGVGLRGVKLRIVRDADLMGRSLFGFAHKKTITLYPDAFANYEILVKTLGHERTHVFQFSLFGSPKNTTTGLLFDDAAYGIENTFWEFYKTNR